MKEILHEWNPWWTSEYQFKGIKREILSQIIPWIDRKEIVSILGVRRGGKTTLFYEIIEHLIKRKGVNPKNILFIKADDDRVEKEKLIDASIDKYREAVQHTGSFYLFIDEVQEIDGWHKTVKRIYDLGGIKIFISGSNSSILKEELGSLLAGRFAYFEVFPFSFSEFLTARGIAAQNEQDITKNKNTIRGYLNEYLSKGAFPEIVLEKSETMKDEIIRFYFDSIFYRDVIRRKNIRNPAKMEKLVKYFLSNISSLANYSKIGRLLDLTVDSVGEYIKALEDAYLLFSINLFEFSYKKQVINPKKVYCVDTGMRNIVGFSFSEDIGKLYENAVYIYLKRKNKEIYYWKNRGECDFVVKAGKALTAIQVAYDVLQRETKEREVRAMLEVMEKFKLKEGTIITENYDSEEKFGDRTLRYIPLWKWLLK